MLLIKEGLPEEDELVLCTINNIHYHSVFARLDEYDKTGLIHISEVSPGRIRNIRDFVVEGKKVVCKVLRVDKVKGHIDLSLRRVNENQKRRKINELKEEQKAEKIIEMVAKGNNIDTLKLYGPLKEKILQKYDDLKSCFKDVVKKNDLLETLGVDKDISLQLVELIKQRFKEEEIVIGGMLKLHSYEPDGLEVVKKALKSAEESDKKVSIAYTGGGSYKLEVKSDNYKEAEKILEKAVKKALSFTEKDLGDGEFIRKEKKE
jgi:translation initiation factor 2 subunit 1